METHQPSAEEREVRAAVAGGAAAAAAFQMFSPAAGVASDFDRLLALFERKNSVRYEVFLLCWKEMNFELIYSGRQDDRECREVLLMRGDLLGDCDNIRCRALLCITFFKDKLLFVTKD